MTTAEGGAHPPSLVLSEIFAHPEQLDELAFREFRPGVEIFPLFGDPAHGPSSALLRYQPGARVDAHLHQGHEQIVVLRGSQEDQAGHYPVGTVIMHHPGFAHEVRSKEGCVVLVTWEKPVKFL